MPFRTRQRLRNSESVQSIRRRNELLKLIEICNGRKSARMRRCSAGCGIIANGDVSAVAFRRWPALIPPPRRTAWPPLLRSSPPPLLRRSEERMRFRSRRCSAPVAATEPSAATISVAIRDALAGGYYVARCGWNGSGSLTGTWPSFGG